MAYSSSLQTNISYIHLSWCDHASRPIFSSRPEDLPLFSPELLSKAIHLLQLMVEYLLNYQEGQDELIYAVSFNVPVATFLQL